MVTLMEYDWLPVGPMGWAKYAAGRPQAFWTFPDADALADGSSRRLIQAFDDSVVSELWRGAAQHRHGGGLEEGADLLGLRRFLRQLGRLPGGHALQQLMITIAVGGAWTAERRAEAGFVDQDDSGACCERCGHEVETDFHRTWGCACNVGSRAYEASQVHVARAQVEHEAVPCFWLRGLVPKRWTEVSPPVEEEQWAIAGSPDGVLALGTGTHSQPLYLFGDASGGSDYLHPALRRVGVAVVS